MTGKSVIRILVIIGLVSILLYVGIGFAFHIGWEWALDRCRAEREARGEFVEPDVFPVLGIFFDLTFWPVYATANLRLDGTIFATPCTHGLRSPPGTKIPRARAGRGPAQPGADCSPR